MPKVSCTKQTGTCQGWTAACWLPNRLNACSAQGADIVFHSTLHAPWCGCHPVNFVCTIECLTNCHLMFSGASAEKGNAILAQVTPSTNGTTMQSNSRLLGLIMHCCWCCAHLCNDCANSLLMRQGEALQLGTEDPTHVQASAVQETAVSQEWLTGRDKEDR